MQQTMLAADPLSPDVALLPLPDPEVARLGSALQELDEEHRIVLFLHYFERLSLPEVARVLDDREESVREVYLQAIAQLGGRVGERRNAA